jgi:hypothetical protein
MKNLSIYYKSNDGEKQVIKYNGVHAIQAGPARDILGEQNARGNGVPLNAPLIMLRLEDGNTATFNADNVTILL